MDVRWRVLFVQAVQRKPGEGEGMTSDMIYSLFLFHLERANSDNIVIYVLD